MTCLELDRWSCQGDPAHLVWLSYINCWQLINLFIILTPLSLSNTNCAHTLAPGCVSLFPLSYQTARLLTLGLVSVPSSVTVCSLTSPYSLWVSFYLVSVFLTGFQDCSVEPSLDCQAPIEKFESCSPWCEAQNIMGSWHLTWRMRFVRACLSVILGTDEPVWWTA